MQLCVACAGDVYSQPSSSEKTALPISFACGHDLCGNCARKKSLTTACILCQSAHDLLAPPTSNSASPLASAPPSYTPTRGHSDGDGFVLGDDSDDDCAFDDDSPPPPPRPEHLAPDAAPPAYQGALTDHDERRDTKREQCDLHYIKPDDTLVGLAMKYRVEGPLLCRMNRLPISTLSTTPHLLHTLPFLVLPPSAAPSTSTTPLLPPFEERKRLIVRRFQVQTRCADYHVAKAYVDAVFAKRREEARFIRLNRDARSGQSSVAQTDRPGGQVDDELREGGELEEAKEQYLADERWEREQNESRRKGKGNGLSFGSRIKSTGQVEATSASRR
ncbi:hypothetical protein JCM11491_004232 [Sporobolomyces phaffii]